MRIGPASYRSIINFEDADEWTVDDDVRTDVGTTVGFFDISHPQPWDNSQRLYTVTEPTLTRLLVKINTPASYLNQQYTSAFTDCWLTDTGPRFLGS